MGGSDSCGGGRAAAGTDGAREGGKPFESAKSDTFCALHKKRVIVAVLAR